jgi:hypothetical protein
VQSRKRLPLAEWQHHIGERLDRLGARLQMGDDSEPAIWVIPDELVASQRPLRYDPRFKDPIRKWHCPLPKEARPVVIEWVERLVQTFSLRSVVCLVETQDLVTYYGGLDLHSGGLLGFYESRGLTVSHQPLKDYRPPTKGQKAAILTAFESLPKPVWMHCSAGADRTTPAAAYIAYSRQPSN